MNAHQRTHTHHISNALSMEHTTVSRLIVFEEETIKLHEINFFFVFWIERKIEKNIAKATAVACVLIQCLSNRKSYISIYTTVDMVYVIGIRLCLRERRKVYGHFALNPCWTHHCDCARRNAHFHRNFTDFDGFPSKRPILCQSSESLHSAQCTRFVLTQQQLQ